MRYFFRKADEASKESDMGFGVTFRELKHKKKIIKSVEENVGIHPFETEEMEAYFYNGNSISKHDAEVIIAQGNLEETQRNSAEEERKKKIREQENLVLNINDCEKSIYALLKQCDYDAALEKTHLGLRLMQTLFDSYEAVKLNTEIFSLREYVRAYSFTRESEYYLYQKDFNQSEIMMNCATRSVDKLNKMHKRLKISTKIRELEEHLHKVQSNWLSALVLNAEPQGELPTCSTTYQKMQESESDWDYNGDPDFCETFTQSNGEVILTEDLSSEQKHTLLMLGITAVSFIGYGIYYGFRYLFRFGEGDGDQLKSSNNTDQQEEQHSLSVNQKKSDDISDGSCDTSLSLKKEQTKDINQYREIAFQMNQKGGKKFEEGLSQFKQGKQCENELRLRNAINCYHLAFKFYRQSWCAFKKAEENHSISQYAINKKVASDSIFLTLKAKHRCKRKVSDEDKLMSDFPLIFRN